MVRGVVLGAAVLFALLLVVTIIVPILHFAFLILVIAAVVTFAMRFSRSRRDRAARRY